MSLVNTLFHKGIITKDEYARIDTIITNKYGLSLDSIYREKEPYFLDNKPL